jgi:iron(III) transport system ATP-binding protein
MVVLEVSRLEKELNGCTVVDNISFTQSAGEKIAIAGETGSGKTSLMKMIAGTLQPDSGTIIFEGKKLRGPDWQLIPGHARVAYLSQHFELRNNYFVHEILSYASDLSDATAANLYRLCRIEGLLQRRTDQLSGGEKQRIALARLLSTRPRLLLLDEPFSNLDPIHRDQIRLVIDDILKATGITCIMVSHDAPAILPWADTIMVMRQGSIVQKGSPEEVYQQPKDRYCAGLFGRYTLHSENFAQQAGESPAPASGMKWMLRPESVRLDESNGLAAVVQSASYTGEGYLLTASLMDEIIYINSAGQKFKAGDTIHVSIQPRQTCWLRDETTG